MSIVVRTWNDKESLTLEGGSLTLCRLGKTKIIPLSQVVSFEVADPKGKLRPGTITIRLSGSMSLEDAIYSAFNIGGSSGVTFYHGYQYLDAARQMQAAIASGSSEETGSAELPVETNRSYAEELRALKSLLDDGIITEDDFNTKKKKLLGI